MSAARVIWDALSQAARDDLLLCAKNPRGVIYPHPELMVYNLVALSGAIATLNGLGRKVVEAGRE